MRLRPLEGEGAGEGRGGGLSEGARGEVSAARCLLSGAVGLWPPPRNPEGAAPATGLPACPAPRPCRPGSARDRCELPRRLAPGAGGVPKPPTASGLPGCRGSRHRDAGRRTGRAEKGTASCGHVDPPTFQGEPHLGSLDVSARTETKDVRGRAGQQPQPRRRGVGRAARARQAGCAEEPPLLLVTRHGTTGSGASRGEASVPVQGRKGTHVPTYL